MNVQENGRACMCSGVFTSRESKPLGQKICQRSRNLCENIPRNAISRSPEVKEYTQQKRARTMLYDISQIIRPGVCGAQCPLCGVLTTCTDLRRSKCGLPATVNRYTTSIMTIPAAGHRSIRIMTRQEIADIYFGLARPAMRFQELRSTVYRDTQRGVPAAGGCYQICEQTGLRSWFRERISTRLLGFVGLPTLM